MARELLDRPHRLLIDLYYQAPNSTRVATISAWLLWGAFAEFEKPYGPQMNADKRR